MDGRADDVVGHHPQKHERAAQGDSTKSDQLRTGPRLIGCGDLAGQGLIHLDVVVGFRHALLSLTVSLSFRAPKNVRRGFRRSCCEGQA